MLCKDLIILIHVLIEILLTSGDWAPSVIALINCGAMALISGPQLVYVLTVPLLTLTSLTPLMLKYVST